jgi:signal transduction histidine kinase
VRDDGQTPRSPRREVVTELSHIENAQEEALERLERIRLELDNLRAARQRGALADDATRRSLERELHDGAQQLLVAVAVNVQLARALVEQDPVAAAEVLDEMARDTQQALESTMRLAQRIHPPLLDAGGLGAALRAAAVANGVRAEISVAPGRLPSPTASAVYFCWLDLLESARDDQPATVVVSSDDDEMRFDLDGPATAALADEVLTRMRDRVEAVGGRLNVDSGQDGRTSVRGWIPLPR